MANQPVKLTRHQIDNWKFVNGTRASGFSGGIFPFIMAGQLWPGLMGQGSRFILEANNLTVLFMQQGSIYVQNTNGFVEDYRTYPVVRGAQGAASMAKISVFVIDALMGIASVAGGAATVAVTGKDLVQFVNKHGSKVIVIGQVFSALAKARAVLLICAPKFYNKVIEVVFKRALDTSWPLLKAAFPYLLKASISLLPNLPEAVDQNFHKSGKATGKLIGKMGTAAMKGRLSFAIALVRALLYILLEFLKAVPRVGKIKAAQYKDLAVQLETALNVSGVYLTQTERDEIMAEIKNSPKKICDSIQALDKALGKL